MRTKTEDAVLIDSTDLVACWGSAAGDKRHWPFIRLHSADPVASIAVAGREPLNELRKAIDAALFGGAPPIKLSKVENSGSLEPIQLDDVDRQLLKRVEQAVRLADDGHKFWDAIDEDEVIEALRLLAMLIEEGHAV